MRITIDMDDSSGALKLAVDRPDVPPPVLSWILRKAEQAVFDPPPQPLVQPAPGTILSRLNGGKRE